MFKDFDISFVDKDDNALPIIVLAGVNGSGKTTLLEYIHNISTHVKEYYNKLSEYDDLYIRDKSGEIIGLEPRPLSFEIEEGERIFNNLKYYNKFLFSPIYFSSGTNDIKQVEEEFVKSWYNQVKFHNKRNNEITESFQKFISEILDGLEFDFNYSYIDEDDNIFFENKNNEKFRISELSTGEQTLLFKVLYLFLKEYREKIILIDEPELSLHPSWQNKVLKIYENFAEKNDCQIIIATHSPHIIGSAKAEYIRVLKKVDNKIEVVEYNQSYGLEFNQILTNIMGIDYLRTPDVAKKMDIVKDLIIKNEYDSNEFKERWIELENILGKNYLDLKLLKLEIASRRKCASNN